MSTSLINSAMSGLNAAQAALNTVSNNISNYNVAGYNRQTTTLSESKSTLTSNGYSGNGVQVTGVQREYDAFISNQLRAAQTQNEGLTTRYQQLSKIDDTLSSTTNSLSANIQDFYKSLQTLTSNAEDPAARQALLGKAEGLVNQFKVNDQYLRDLNTQVNMSVSSSVEQINTYTSQIATLNEQIGRLSNVGGSAQPNDLLDQRDQLVSSLNKVIGTEVLVQDSGTYNLSFANGISLVQGSSSFKLAAVPSSSDPSRITIAQGDDAAGNIEIPENQIKGGSLAGFLTFRAEDLSDSRNRLGQLAQAFASSFNQQHAKGYDADSNPGEDLFTLGAPVVLNNSNNHSQVAMNVSRAESSKIQASDYQMAFDGSNWSVTRLSDNARIVAEQETSSDGQLSLSFDGLKVDVSGAPARHDRFLIKPVAEAVVNMAVVIKDESQLALAAEPNAGQSDNRNAQALLDLQSAKVVGGNKSANDAYASLISEVGNRTASMKVVSTTQNDVVTQLNNQQQSISGVNLDEEYGNLQRFQQYYMANAQVLKTASTLFDALLDIR